MCPSSLASTLSLTSTGAGTALGAFAAAKSAHGLSTLAAVRAAGVVAARSVQAAAVSRLWPAAADLDLGAPAVDAPPAARGCSPSARTGRSRGGIAW